MLLNTQPHFAPTLQRRIYARIRVERRIVSATESRQVFEYSFTSGIVKSADIVGSTGSHLAAKLL